jgi:hypothetical protein
MLTFLEWLKAKNEAVGRLAQREPLYIPEATPEVNHIVVFIDKPKAIITNDDVYVINNKTNDGFGLQPKNPKNPPAVLSLAQWNGSPVPRTLLSGPEQMMIDSAPTIRDMPRENRTVWAIGATKDKWMKNRQKLRDQQARKKGIGDVAGVTPHEPISPSKLLQIKQGLTADQPEKEDPQAAFHRLFGPG